MFIKIDFEQLPLKMKKERIAIIIAVLSFFTLYLKTAQKYCIFNILII